MIFNFAYAVPFLIVGLFAPRAVLEWGAWRAAASTAAIAALAGLVLALYGAIHRQSTEGAAIDFDWLNALSAAVVLLLLLAPNAVTISVARRRGLSIDRQRQLTLLTSIGVGLLAYLPFLLTVGCVLTGECL